MLHTVIAGDLRLEMRTLAIQCSVVDVTRAIQLCGFLSFNVCTLVMFTRMTYTMWNFDTATPANLNLCKRSTTLVGAIPAGGCVLISTSSYHALNLLTPASKNSVLTIFQPSGHLNGITNNRKEWSFEAVEKRSSVRGEVVILSHL